MEASFLDIWSRNWCTEMYIEAEK